MTNPAALVKDPAAKQLADAKNAAQQFEAFFMNYLLQEMKQNTMTSGLFGDGLGSDTYTDMFNEELSKVMAQKGGFGLADMVTKYLENKMSLNNNQPSSQPASDASQPIKATGTGVSSGSSPQIPDLSTASQQIRQDFLNAVSASLATINTTASNSIDGMQAPLDTGRISSGFGMRVDPITGQHKYHEGIDIAAPAGTDIHAADAGQVVFAGKQGGYGNTVIIQHSNGLRTRYAHAESLTVREGDTVEAGQIVGRVGSTGRSTGSHLHFEVIQKDGQRLNPGKFLAKVIA
ncbi:MAG TPA: peptidoglycan DD-metalloendopeptidase family protein [Blastocatellia bacterium]|nr:peptidoglycan DD-metalloendopeptidase family protein [Blastocatellia bacterium]